MARINENLRKMWEKNWPEVRAGATGGLPAFIFSRRPPDLGSSVPVFCYHVVNTDSFKADLDFLIRNGYVTVDADTLLDHLEERRQAPQRAVVLTIDDGARNLYEVAFPLLRHYGMRAVAFIAPRFHEEESRDFPYDVDKLLRPLSWSQIREMHTSEVIDFQSHTYEHRYIPRWPEPADLEGSDPEVVSSFCGAVLTIREDFRLANEVFERKLNKTVGHLAFPRFKGTSAAVQIGSELGYKAFWWGVLPRRTMGVFMMSCDMQSQRTRGDTGWPLAQAS